MSIKYVCSLATALEITYVCCLSPRSLSVAKLRLSIRNLTNLATQRMLSERLDVCARAIDNTCSWVMLDQQQGFVRLPGEQPVWKSPARTSLAITTPRSYPGNNPVALNSNAGTVYLTNQRVSLGHGARSGSKCLARSFTSHLHPPTNCNLFPRLC